jgi:hypothetical protein
MHNFLAKLTLVICANYTANNQDYPTKVSASRKFEGTFSSVLGAYQP